MGVSRTQVKLCAALLTSIMARGASHQRAKNVSAHITVPISDAPSEIVHDTEAG